MQSHSRSHLQPGFFNHHEVHKLSASLVLENPPSAEQLHLWSHHQPSLTVGDYTLHVVQDVTLPTGQTVSLQTPSQALRVSKPKFRLTDPTALYSVHPAPGHSAYARTLANRDILPGKGVGFNKLPSMAVLTFSEEEFVLDPDAWRGFGFTEESEKPTEYGSIATKESRLIDPTCTIKSTLNAPGSNTDFEPEDELNLLLLDSQVFKGIFTAYGEDNKPGWTGQASLSKFAFMTSAQESASGFTAGLFSDDSEQGLKPHFSVIVSPRTGPLGQTSPVRVVSHLISLEDVDKISVSPDDTSGQLVGLVSLHAWEWMCVPEDSADFGHVMTELGQHISPLKGPFDPKGKEGEELPSEAVSWLKGISDAGTRVLLRGPLIPVKPDMNSVEAFSLNGEGMSFVDETTGRSMMMADRSLSASLLRLRAKAKAIQNQGYRALSSKESFLSGLQDTIKNLGKAQDVSGLGNKPIASRWTRTEPEIARFPINEYDGYVEQAGLHMFGYESQDPDGKAVPPRIIDADAAAVRAWAIDRFLLAGIPMHYLVLSPEMLPLESIRTFCVDSNWINFLVDGGLSLANHFARDDDAVRRVIKKCINKYLSTSTNGGTIPQLPRWGFMMRSVAVSAFPDLRVEAPLPPDAPSDAREVLFMQRLADDVLRELDRIVISQPHHQQGFSLGTTMDETRLTVWHRAVPKYVGQTVGLPVSQTFKAGGPIDGFDFKARMLRLDAYMEAYCESVQNDQGAFTDEYRLRPSSLLATQLRNAHLRLQLDVETSVEGDEQTNVSDRWTKPAIQLSEGSRPEPSLGGVAGQDECQSEKSGTVVRAPPRTDIGLPTSPRIQITNSASLVTIDPDMSPWVVYQQTSSNRLPYYATPQNVSCCLYYEPGNASNYIYATETPVDVIFNLSANESSGLPQEVEIRIPIALDSGIYPAPVKDGSRGVFVIPALPEEGDLIPIESEKLVMLIIKLKPRFGSSFPGNASAFETSFILRRMTFLLPTEGTPNDPKVTPSRTARFDTLWQSSKPGIAKSVRTTQLTILPAVMINFKKTTQFRLGDCFNLGFTLSRLPPGNSRCRLHVKPQTRQPPFTEGFSLIHPTLMPDGGYECSGFCTVDLGRFEDKGLVPLELRIDIMDHKFDHLLGPESEPFVFPRVPDIHTVRGSMSYYWGDDKHLSIIWPPYKGFETNLKRKFFISNRKELDPEPEVPYFSCEMDDKSGIIRIWPTDCSKYGDPESGLDIGYSLETTSSLIERAINQGTALLSARPKMGQEEMPNNWSGPPAVPMPGSRLATICYCDNTGNTGTQVWYWDKSSRRLKGFQYTGKSVILYNPNGPRIEDSLNLEITGAGAIAIVQTHQDNRFKIIWIGSDGSVNAWSRTEETSIWHSYGDASVVAPAGSASTHGGGCLAVCGETPTKEFKKHRDPIIWWLGPRGEVFGRRLVGDSEHWVDVGPKASHPAGSVDVSQSLKRPAQIATAWSYDSETNHRSYLFWVRSNGDLMTTCLHDDNPGQTAVAYQNIDAAPGTSLTAFIGAGRQSPDKVKVYVLWISADLSVCLGCRTGLPDDTRYPNGSDQIVRICSPGCANPLSDLCFIGHTRVNAAAVVWADPNGKLQVAWAESSQTNPQSEQNEWLTWGWKEWPSFVTGVLATIRFIFQRRMGRGLYILLT
ncbi:hypothetical protein DER45DRAFT_623849 [Fusarium avenaceum]|nr:hypothetical protein DER45DRAFT_623849 [Fusarium avenaceum]